MLDCENRPNLAFRIRSSGFNGFELQKRSENRVEPFRFRGRIDP